MLRFRGGSHLLGGKLSSQSETAGHQVRNCRIDIYSTSFDATETGTCKKPVRAKTTIHLTSPEVWFLSRFIEVTFKKIPPKQKLNGFGKRIISLIHAKISSS
jgi:hypothetical protein